MAIADFFKALGQARRTYRYAKMLSGYTPVFSQFGENVYVSDVVQNCIDVIATECSKLQPRHLRIDRKTQKQDMPDSAFNRLFEFAPNPLMTTRDFIEKVIWSLYLNYNSFIYPMYVVKTDAQGREFREFTSFWPIQPRVVTFLQDPTDRIFVEMQFEDGTKTVLPYDDVIHIRKKFSVNSFMGGGWNGQPDNAPLLKVLQINDALMQSLEKGVKTSMAIRGLLKIPTVTDDDKQKAQREAFEARLLAGESGILTYDLKGEYTPVTVDPKMVDKDTLDFLQNKVLNNYGVSVPILTGDYNDDQYQAFYEKTLEPIVIALSQAFTRVMFTAGELSHGNKIMFLQKDMMYLSAKARLELIKTAGEQGLLTDDQKLAIIGYPPLADGSGNRRTMSLNYIDTELANEYQLKQATTAAKEGK